MKEVRFYSEFDMGCGFQIDNIIERINMNAIEDELDCTEVINFYNVLKYISIERFANYIEEKTGIDIKMYERKIKQKIGMFIGKNKINFINIYNEIDFTLAEDFLEIIEKYGIYNEISENDFKEFMDKEHMHVYIVLKFKKLVEYYDNVIKDKILSNLNNTETIISKYLNNNRLYLPASLTNEEVLKLMDKYIASNEANINVLRKIVTFPTGTGLNIPDKIKLHAKRKMKDEEEKIFSNGTGVESGISISYPTDQEEAVLVSMDNRIVDIKVSRKWLEENLDYPTLWNNFIYIFNFVDEKFCLEFDSKQNEVSALERVIRDSGPHLFNKSFSFITKEMISDAEIFSYTNALNILGVRIESMIEWFFNKYIKEEFNINEFIVKLPSENTSYFEKCRSILPEIDRIFKQYNVLIEEGEIDQELIQMSSSSVKNKDIKTFNHKKYAYPSGDWYKTASFLLFSDQSSIFYMPNKGNHKNFLDLIIKEKVFRCDFKQYQLQRMQWLFDNNIISEDESGYLKFIDLNLIYVLKELYYNDVLSYWHYPEEIKKVIERLEEKNHVCFESTLFSRNEQDYFDYYLNKTKFTNGYDIRNKYLHGTNSNDEKQYEVDYYRILKLIVIIIIKINDDLCIKEELLDIIDDEAK